MSRFSALGTLTPGSQLTIRTSDLRTQTSELRTQNSELSALFFGVALYLFKNTEEIAAPDFYDIPVGEALFDK